MAQLRDLAAAAVRIFDLRNKNALPYAYHGLHHLVRSQIAHRRALMRDHCRQVGMSCICDRPPR
jgi:hypothetical protein